MKPEDIHLTDWMRMLLGEVPWSFLLEAGIRIIFLYFLILVSMRLLGSRMAGQVSRNEMAALVSLAATVGVPMQAPDRGLLPALVAAAVIVGIGRWVAHQTFKSKNFEYTALDDIGILVKEGCLQIDIMQEIALPRERLLAQLRSSGIDHLGKVKRLYMEANGNFTLKKQDNPLPGLSILPDWDTDMTKRHQKSPDTFACANCGNTQPGAKPPVQPCSNCQETHWTPAVVS